MKRITFKRLAIFLACVLCLGVFSYEENNLIDIAEYVYVSNKVPESFDGFRIVQLSDLHNKSFGKEQEELISIVRSLEPDIIAITGDIISDNSADYDNAVKLIGGIKDIAPIYYVMGNHEENNPLCIDLIAALKAQGVTVFENQNEKVHIGEDYINVAGVSNYLADAGSGAADILNSLTESDCLNVLLAHRPEIFPIYASAGMDIVFSGHAHGGQVRLPVIGGLFAPNQGFLPEYDSGEYVSGGSTMYVSPGLGNSVIPQRVFNHPEIIVVTLERG